MCVCMNNIQLLKHIDTLSVSLETASKFYTTTM